MQESMATEDRVPIIEVPSKQNTPDVVTSQPRAKPSRSTTGISTLSIVTKALLGKEPHGCYCLVCPGHDYQQSASALLIGTNKHQDQSTASQSLNSIPPYISSLKQHLTELNIEIFGYKPNYHDSRDDLHQLISEFFAKPDPSLFIVYYSGPINAKGDWLISTKDDYGEECEEDIRLDTITRKWKRAKSTSNCHLLIVLDAENSGKWVEKVKKHESEANIIIMASSGSDDEERGSTQQHLGQYTQSLIGSQGHGFYPSGAQEMIKKYLAKDPSSTNGLLCYVHKSFACYK